MKDVIQVQIHSVGSFALVIEMSKHRRIVIDVKRIEIIEICV